MSASPVKNLRGQLVPFHSDPFCDSVYPVGRVSFEVETDHPASGLKQCLAIPQRLGLFQHPEGDRRRVLPGFVRYRRVPFVIRGDLDEEPVSGVALV